MVYKRDQMRGDEMVWTDKIPTGDVDISYTRGMVAEYYRQYITPSPNDPDTTDQRMVKMLNKIRSLSQRNSLKLEAGYQQFRSQTTLRAKVVSQEYESKTVSTYCPAGCDVIPESVVIVRGNGYKGHAIEHGNKLLLTVGGQDVECEIYAEARYEINSISNYVSRDLATVRAECAAANLPTDITPYP